MKDKLKLIVASAVCVLGIGYSLVVAGTNGLDLWMSGSNNNKLVEIQNQKHSYKKSGDVEVAFFSNSSFRVTSPKGITVLVDPWRNDPSGAWGLWYRMDFPKVDVDIVMSTHAHFDHDAIGAVDSHMILDRMAGEFTFGDVKITGIADKHQCLAPGLIPWTDAVKQFEGREVICGGNPDINYRHLDNSMYLIETGGMKFLMWGDNRPDPSEKALSMIGNVDVVFVPVDGSKHILDYSQADKVVSMVKANIAIPHHYLVKETTFVTSTLFPALEWAQTHENTLLDAATVTINKSVLKGKDGHVYYFGSNQLGSIGSKN